MPEKLSLSLLGKRYEISLEGVHPRTHKEFAWLSERSTLDVKELLRAYLEKCQECAEMQEALEKICDKLDQH